MKRRPFLIAALLCLVYTAQALAAGSAPCPRMHHAGAAAGDPTGMVAAAVPDGHRHHAPVASGSPAHHDQGHDCCGSGLCFMSQCHALLALPATPTDLFRPPPDVFDVPMVILAPVRPASSSFRPPTFA